MSDTDTASSEPAAGTVKNEGSGQIWLRGLWMLLLLALFSIARGVLIAVAILQFGWMLFTKKANGRITEFGSKLGNWMAITARYLAAESEEKPFPWTAWR